MSMHPNTFLPGATKRIEALSDGVFAIACTLLVLEVHIPQFPAGLSNYEQWEKLKEIFPSMFGFVFSFLNILVFWVNHDAINKVIVRYDTKITYLNIIFLLLISLIPFTTGFISKNPGSIVAISSYGVVLFFASLIAIIMYYHLAFRSDLFLPNVTMASRKKVWRMIAGTPVLYAFAIAAGFISVYIPIGIYAIVPVIFMFFPQMEFESEVTENENHVA
jgi:uncharacterized membrane protein